MTDHVQPGPLSGENHGFYEAVCIDTYKVYDTCRVKDCLEDLRVYLTAPGKLILDSSVSVRATRAEIIHVYTDVKPVPFNRGFYSIDAQFYFKLTFEAYNGTSRPQILEGLAAYTKKTILYGSEGAAIVFTSNDGEGVRGGHLRERGNLPIAVIEAVEPIVLGLKVADSASCEGAGELEAIGVPDYVAGFFDDPIMFAGDGKRILMSLGLFSIMRLERKVQILVPTYELAIPENGNSVTGEGDPCELFSKMQFPLNEFYPPVFGDDQTESQK